MKVIRFTSANRWFREAFGSRVQRLTLAVSSTCPNRDGTLGFGGCLYCDVRGSAADSLDFAQSLSEQFTAGRVWIGQRYPGAKILLYAQPFTSMMEDWEDFRDEVGPLLNEEGVVGMSVATRPDSLPEPWLSGLQDLASRLFIEVEIGLESANDATLAAVNRGHDVQTFDAAVRRVAGLGIPVVAHVILGLPGEGRDDFIRTARHLSTLPLHSVKIHTFHLLASSPLAHLYGLKKGDLLEGGETLTAKNLPSLRILTRDAYAEALGDFLLNLSPGIVLYRITGERRSDDLIGPQWVREKRRTLTLLRMHLKTRGIELE